MEYFPNLSVEDYVLKLGWLYYRTARTCALQMANAIAYLHGRKPHHFIHRDIKPSVTCLALALALALALTLSLHRNVHRGQALTRLDLTLPRRTSW